MAERDIYCGEHRIGVRRWIKPSFEIESGATTPFLVDKEWVQFVRAHQDEPFVLKTPFDSWALEVLSIESTGTDGVWVTARVVSRVNRREIVPTPGAVRGTLQGIPVPGVDE